MRVREATIVIAASALLDRWKARAGSDLGPRFCSLILAKPGSRSSPRSFGSRSLLWRKHRHRRICLAGRSQTIQLQKAMKNLFSAKRIGPPIGREDCAIESLMYMFKPGGLLVIEVGEGPVLEVSLGGAERIDPGVTQTCELAGCISYRFDAGVGIFRWVSACRPG